MPASSAGPPGATETTSLDRARRPVETRTIVTAGDPRYARSRRCPSRGRARQPAVSIGTAKPMPTLPPPTAAGRITVDPDDPPAASISGPPELPGLIAASVWMTSSILEARDRGLDARCLAETTPVVSVRSRPNGLPIATIGSPTSTSSPTCRASAGEDEALGVDLEHREIGRAVATADLGGRRPCRRRTGR